MPNDDQGPTVLDNDTDEDTLPNLKHLQFKQTSHIWKGEGMGYSET